MTKFKKKFKIAVAMSGGVDSSVAAKLLKDQGHEVVGIFLHYWKEENPTQKGKYNPPRPPYQGGNFENKCCSAEALLDARRVAKKIGLPFYTLNFARIFKKQVVDNFLAEYARGRTPNPCVRCNKFVKLGWLIKQTKKLGFDYVATGHYARLRREFPNLGLDGRPANDQFPKKTKNTNNKYIYKLYKARDENKDQSYFLYTLNQKELAHLLFPLGGYTKPQVRRMAKKFKLPVAEKPDSQEICFIPEKNHNEFLKRHLKLKPGPIVILERSASQACLSGRQAIQSRGASGENQDSISSPGLSPGLKAAPSRMTAGKVIGAHQGLPLYTIGQRKGLKIGGLGPFYAAKMDYKKNILYVVNKSHHPLLHKSWLIAKNINWLAGFEPKLPLSCEAVMRYHHEAAKCVITKIDKPSTFIKVLGKNNFKVRFSKPQRAITPGQSVVFYSGSETLGGGVICPF